MNKHKRYWLRYWLEPLSIVVLLGLFVSIVVIGYIAIQNTNDGARQQATLHQVTTERCCPGGQSCTDTYYDATSGSCRLTMCPVFPWQDEKECYYPAKGVIQDARE